MIEFRPVNIKGTLVGMALVALESLPTSLAMASAMTTTLASSSEISSILVASESASEGVTVASSAMIAAKDSAVQSSSKSLLISSS